MSGGGRPGTQPDGSLDLPKRIVVGVDGSTAAAGALSWAARLAADLDAEVVAVHALGTRAPEPVTGPIRRHLDGSWVAGVKQARRLRHRRAHPF